MIDSLNGYQAAMPEEQALILHMHELLQYLNRQGASTFLTVAQHGLVGDMKAPVDVTYLADTVILLRYFEALGRVRRAMSVIKKRTGAHEDTIREYRIDGRGITLGEPLMGFQGVLRGVPELVDGSAPDKVARAGRRVTIAVSERALILAPQGRDASVARGMLGEAGLRSDVGSGHCAIGRWPKRWRGLCGGHRGSDHRTPICMLCRNGSTRSPNGPTSRSFS